MYRQDPIELPAEDAQIEALLRGFSPAELPAGIEDGIARAFASAGDPAAESSSGDPDNVVRAEFGSHASSFWLAAAAAVVAFAAGAVLFRGDSDEPVQAGIPAAEQPVPAKLVSEQRGDVENPVARPDQLRQVSQVNLLRGAHDHGVIVPEGETQAYRLLRIDLLETEILKDEEHGRDVRVTRPKQRYIYVPVRAF
ncbi:MAG: hypothetical protein R3F11_32970 [Verrucomicrobiales bacterium]